MTRLCTVKGCGREHDARGYCTKHRHNWKRHGAPIAPPRPKMGYVAKLDARKVRTIRALARTVRTGALAERFRVDRSTIQRIVRGSTWRHVD